MSDESTAPAGDTVSIPLPSDAPATMTVSEAARLLSQARRQPEPPAESAPEATAEEPPLAEKADTDPPQEAPGDVETQEIDPAEEPPIEPPRSWTKAEKERFASLPRETQEYLHTREQERDREFRRSQNEVAEQRKAIQAEREAAEKARQQYEAQLPALMQELQNVNQSSFSDIKTMDDVVKLQAEDPFRFQAWQVHQMRLQAAKAETDRVQAQKDQDRNSKRSTYEAEQNKLLIGLVPEMAEPKKASELRERAIAMLTDPDDLGLKNEQLSRWMADDTGHEILSNAGIQKLIADGLKYRDILKAPKAVAAKPVPPVQKPGVRQTGNAQSERIQALTRQLNETGDLRAAQELRALQVRSRAS